MQLVLSEGNGKGLISKNTHWHLLQTARFPGHGFLYIIIQTHGVCNGPINVFLYYSQVSENYN